MQQKKTALRINTSQDHDLPHYRSKVSFTSYLVIEILHTNYIYIWKALRAGFEWSIIVGEEGAELVIS